MGGGGTAHPGSAVSMESFSCVLAWACCASLGEHLGHGHVTVSRWCGSPEALKEMLRGVTEEVGRIFVTYKESAVVSPKKIVPELIA